MYCLDTSVIIDFLRKEPNIGKRFVSLDSSKIFVSTITLCELYMGAYLSSRSDISLMILDSFINSVNIVEFNIDSCKWFGKEFARLAKAGKMPQEPDLMIASIAKSNNLVVVTRDKKGFKNIDVSSEEW